MPQIEIIDANSSDYPQAMREQFAKQSPRLFMRGNADLLNKQSVGVCGSRKASDEGNGAIRELAKAAADSHIVVVSGNAKGVDRAAHRACLERGGETILVLPEGIDHFKINRDLKDVWDWERVLVISQFEPEAIWRSWRAMQRNKLVIALSRAVIIVEAGSKGGTLNAGETTLKKNLPLYVAKYDGIPETATGNRHLLALGAQPISIEDDFIATINQSPKIKQSELPL